MSKGNILFQLSGSIACFKSAQVISRLVQSGYDVETVATQAALEFIGEATLEGLTGRRVHTDTFEPGRYMSHIHLAKWADLTVLCPASANTLNKLSCGIGDDLVSTLFLAHDFSKPFLIAPAMNTKMYLHPATVHSLDQLKAWGIKVLDTAAGSLACGDNGLGRLPDPEQIYLEIEGALSNRQRPGLTNSQSKRSQSVLITAGGTREPIDGVRSLTNSSSGRTGAAIAEHFAAQGHHVTLVQAESAVRPRHNSQIEIVDFVTFADLENVLQKKLTSKPYDSVIHLAAVSDYRVDQLTIDGKDIKPSEGVKIDASGDLLLHLKLNPKLVDRLREFSCNPKIKIVAFKLTRNSNESQRRSAVEKLGQQSGADFVISNDLSEIETNSDQHLSVIYATFAPDELSGKLPDTRSSNRHVRKLRTVFSKFELAEALETLLCQEVKNHDT